VVLSVDTHAGEETDGFDVDSPHAEILGTPVSASATPARKNKPARKDTPIRGAPRPTRQFSATAYPPLPVEATPENFDNDRNAARDMSIQDDFHSGDYVNSRANQDRMSRARLMVGIYGVDAKVPCKRCVDTGRKCRIYHPVMYTPAWRRVNGMWKFRVRSQGLSCSDCTVYRSRGDCEAH
jgi:hypothetical protein